MDQITNIITTSAMSILVVLTGIVVQAIKKYLVMRGGKKAIEIVEILAKNAVNATEQVADKLDIHGKDKLEHAKTSLIEGLESQNIHLTNQELNTFIVQPLNALTKNGRNREVEHECTTIYRKRFY